MSTFLERILARKRVELAERRSRVPEAELERVIRDLPVTRDFLGRLDRASVGVIAEIKRASPSKGAIALDLDAVLLAHEYAGGGADAISVLTDQEFYGGSLDDLREIAAAVPVPAMRKDFVLDRYGLLEARVAGADMVLLIVAALDEATLRRLVGEAQELGLTPLVEVYTEEEARVAVRIGARLVGINNRNLHTFDVTLETTERLAPLLTSHAVVASLSGMSAPADVVRVARTGARVVLVGEALVRAEDPAALIRRFKGVAVAPPAASEARR